MKLRTTPQRPRSARSTLRRLGRYLMRSAPMLALALILTLAGNVFALIGPTLCGYAIDATAAGRGGVRFDVVFYYAWRMLALYVLSALMNYVVSLLILRVSQRTVRAMRADVFAKLMKLPVGYFDRRQAGEILSHITYDIDTVNASLSNDLVQILTSAVRDLRAHRNHPVVFIRGKALHPRSGKNGHRVMDGFHVPVFLHHIFRNRHIQIFLIGKDTSVLGNHHDGFLAVIIFKQLFNVRHQRGTEALIVFLQILPQDRAVGKNIRFPLHSGNIGSNVITAQFQKIMGFGNHLIHQQTGCKEINGPAQNQYYRQPQAQIKKRNLHAEPAEPVSDPTSVFHVPPPF